MEIEDKVCVSSSSSTASIQLMPNAMRSRKVLCGVSGRRGPRIVAALLRRVELFVGGCIEIIVITSLCVVVDAGGAVEASQE